MYRQAFPKSLCRQSAAIEVSYSIRSDQSSIPQVTCYIFYKGLIPESKLVYQYSMLQSPQITDSLDLAAVVDSFSQPSANFFFEDLFSSLIWTCMQHMWWTELPTFPLPNLGRAHPPSSHSLSPHSLLGLPPFPLPNPVWDLVPSLPHSIPFPIIPPSESQMACFLTHSVNSTDTVILSCSDNNKMLRLQCHYR